MTMEITTPVEPPMTRRERRARLPDVEKVGRTVREFADAVSLSPAWVYRLWSEHPDKGPHFVMSGRRRIVLESPREYLERMAVLQAGKDR